MPHDPRPTLEHPRIGDVRITQVLHALSDPSRLAIVRALHDDPAGRACGAFPVSVAPSTLSHHFKVLRESGLVYQVERGVQRWSTLREDELNARFPGLLRAVLADDGLAAEQDRLTR